MGGMLEKPEEKAGFDEGLFAIRPPPTLVYIDNPYRDERYQRRMTVRPRLSRACYRYVLRAVKSASSGHRAPNLTFHSHVKESDIFDILRDLLDYSAPRRGRYGLRWGPRPAAKAPRRGTSSRSAVRRKYTAPIC